MIDAMTQISNGKVLTKEEAYEIVRREQSFKYIGSTAYRPDIAGASRVSQEIRDAHKDEAMLIDKTARAVAFAQYGRQAFIGMGDIKVALTAKKFLPRCWNIFKNSLKIFFL